MLNGLRIRRLICDYGLLACSHCTYCLPEHSGVYAFCAMGMEKRVDGAEDTHGIHTGICRTGRRSWVYDGVLCTQNDRFLLIDTKFTLCHFSA
nr:MAG TPA: hypothetical protein [Caudoviricetes sp.]